MSYNSLHFSINRKKITIISGFFIAILVASFSSYIIVKEIVDANAIKSPVLEEMTSDRVSDAIPTLDLQIDPQDLPLENTFAEDGLIGVSSLPNSYDSRAHGYISRQENQAGEGLCWAYSFTTTAESYLLRTGLVSEAIEFSPKHLDYLLAPTSEALSDSSLTNKYEEYDYGFTNTHRELSSGEDLLSVLIASSGKYSLTSDDAFFAKMKLNDPNTLSNFNSYGDFIVDRREKYYADRQANGSTNLPLNYTTKQKYVDVFNKNSASYAVTGADYIFLGDYSSSDTSEKRTQAIEKIKNAIMDYGAVVAGSHYNEEKCMYKNSNNYVIIDRTTSSSPNACDKSASDPSGHGITLVGWDDNVSYEDSGSKTGAFIVQNSYGDKGINYYLSYSSYIKAFSINSMEKTDSFSNIFDITDYTKTINADDYEVIFDFPATGPQKLTEVTAYLQSITKSPLLGYDIYVKSGSGQYKKVGRVDDGDYSGLFNIKRLNVNTNNNFSIKIKYEKSYFTISGLTPQVFNDKVAKYMSVAAYMAPNSNTTPSTDPPSDPKPTTDNIDDEKDIPVPNSSGPKDITVTPSNNTNNKNLSSPGTGSNMSESTPEQKNDLSIIHTLFIASVVIFPGCLIIKNKKRIKFNSK